MAHSLFRNFSLKVLSGGIAVVLWMSVAGDRVVERGLEIPVEFENVPAGLEIAGHPPDTVRVRVRGSGVIIGSLAAGDVAAVIDLSAVQAGRREIEVVRERVRAPSGVEVTSVAPVAISVMLEGEAADAHAVRH